MQKSGDRLPTPISAALILVLVLLAGDLIVFRWIAPSLLRAYGMDQLKEAINRIALIVYLTAFAAGFCAGLGATLMNRRPNRSQVGTLIGVLLGLVLVLGGLFGYAWASKQPLPLRGSEVNTAVIGAGAFLGWLLIAVISRARPTAIPPPPPPPPLRPPSLAQTLSMLLVLPVGFSGFAPLSVGASRLSTQRFVLSSADIAPGDCELTSLTETASGDIYLFGIDVGGNWAYREVRHPSSWDAEVTAGLQSGLRLGIGEHIGQRVLQGTPFSEGLSLNLSALGLLTLVNVYDLQDQTTADNTVRWQLEGLLTDSLVLPTLSQFMRPTETPDTIASRFESHAPKRIDLELGGKLTLEVAAGAGLPSYSFDMDLGTTAGVRLFAPSPSPTSPGSEQLASPSASGGPPPWIRNPAKAVLYMKLDGELDAQATYALWALGGVGSGSLEMSVELQPSLDPSVWKPHQLTLIADVALAGQGGISLSSDQISSMSSALGAGADQTLLSPLKIGVESKASLGGHLELTRSLSFDEHPQDIAVFTAWFTAFQRELRRDATSSDRQQLDQLSTDLSQVLDRDSTYEAKGNLTAKGQTSYDVELADFLANGSKGSVELSLERLLVAAFRDSSQTWQTSKSCKPFGPTG